MEKSQLDSETFKKIQALARLRLSPEEAELLQGQIGAIISFVGQLREIETEGVPSAPEAAAVHAKLRPDEVLPGLSADEALSNAPDRQGDLFRVPGMLEGVLP